MKNLPNLYPLRFLLSIVVVIFHLPMISSGLNIPSFNNSPIFQKGTLAVFYFFSLSGFLILRLIYLELQKTSSFNFKEFYLRRISRLYPVYYLVFFVAIFLYHYLLPKIGIPFRTDYKLSELILDYVLIIPNVFKHYHSDVGSIFIVLWSIGVEEQFYLIIPFYLYLFRKNVIISISSLLILLLLILLFFPNFYIYDNLYFYFIFGGLLSIFGINKRLKPLGNKYFQFIIYISFILSFATNLFVFGNIFLSHLLNLLISGLLIAMITDYPIWEVKSKIIDHFGKISYGIYMYHMIVITGILFIIKKFEIYQYFNKTVFIISLNLIVISITIAVAHCSFKYFESLFYKSKAK